MSTTTNSPPPWQVLDLVATHLDPKTLATACCVCKTWLFSLSSDHIWQPICHNTYSSLSNLLQNANASCTTSSYLKLYSLGRASENRRLKKPAKPKLTLRDLIFAIDIGITGQDNAVTIVRSGEKLKLDRHGVFRFDIDLHEVIHNNIGDNSKGFDQLGEYGTLRVSWNVLLDGYKGLFTMMDCEGKGRFVMGLEGWFSMELPETGCCSGVGGGLVAEMMLGLCEIYGGGGKKLKVVVEKVSLGILSVVSWRYLCVEDALRYLEHFLL